MGLWFGFIVTIVCTPVLVVAGAAFAGPGGACAMTMAGLQLGMLAGGGNPPLMDEDQMGMYLDE
jgi:hypothetical protein